MNMQGVGGHGFNYPSLIRSRGKADDTPPAVPPGDGAGASPPAGPAGPGFRALSGALVGNVTGAVTAHLPNGIELGIYSFAPVGADPGDADAPAGPGPDFAAMTAAIEDMVDHFMAATAAAAKSAYQQGALTGTGTAQRGAAGFIA